MSAWDAALKACPERSRRAPHHPGPTYRLGVMGCGAGAGACCAGGSGLDCVGAVFAGADFDPSSTDPMRCERRAANTESVMDENIKMMAAQVVALLRTVAAVRVPNAVWLPMPPKAAAISPLWPLCSSTTMIRNRQTIMWMAVISATM